MEMEKEEKGEEEEESEEGFIARAIRTENHLEPVKRQELAKTPGLSK